MKNIKSVVYLTTYTGDKLPPYYIGSTTLDNYNQGYFGSPTSKKYADVFSNELKEHPEKFSKEILEYCDTRKEALERELYYHIKHDVVNSELYFNMSLATINGFFGMSVTGVDSPAYGNKNCAGRVWVNNGFVSKMMYECDIPDGWERGRCEKDRDSIKRSTIGRKQNAMWIYNTNTNESKKIPKTDDIPDGWERGRGDYMKNLAKTRVLRKYQWYHDPITQKDVRVYEGDDASHLVKGRSDSLKRKISETKTK